MRAMNCTSCGATIPDGASSCPACGRPVAPPPGNPAGHSDPVDKLVSELSTAARDLTVAAAKLSRGLLRKAESAAKDPSNAARRVIRRATEELEAARREVEKALKDLK